MRISNTYDPPGDASVRVQRQGGWVAPHGSITHLAVFAALWAPCPAPGPLRPNHRPRFATPTGRCPHPPTTSSNTHQAPCGDPPGHRGHQTLLVSLPQPAPGQPLLRGGATQGHHPPPTTMATRVAGGPATSRGGSRHTGAPSRVPKGTWLPNRLPTMVPLHHH